MRVLLALALVCAAGCEKPIYRDVNGEPISLYWRCKDDVDAANRIMVVRGHAEPCPASVDVWCPDGTGPLEHYVIVEVDHSVFARGDLPEDEREMCARIRRH